MRQRGEGGGEGGEGEGAGDKGDGCFVYGVVFRVFRNVLNVRPSVRQGLKCSSAPHLCMVPRSINFLYFSPCHRSLYGMPARAGRSGAADGVASGLRPRGRVMIYLLRPRVRPRISNSHDTTTRSDARSRAAPTGWFVSITLLLLHKGTRAYTSHGHPAADVVWA